MLPEQANDMDEHIKTITVERPTGPRIAPEQHVSLGQLVVSKGKSIAKSVGTVAALSVAVLAKYKWAIGSSAVLAVSTHLIVASMMMGIIADKKPTISTSFTGPGDVKSGAQFWNGLRAYSSAKRGNPAINLCNVADAACADVATDAVTGNLVAPTNIGGVDCTAITVCTVKILYDQTQGTNCAGPAACDATQPTIASRFTFTWNCQNGHPCLKRNGGGVIPAQGPSFTVSLPYTVIGVGNRTGATTTQTALLRPNGLFLLWTSSANTAGIFGGGFVTATASDTNPHAFLAIFTAAGTSCTFEVDGIGSPSTGSCGTSTDGTLTFGTDATNAMTGNYYESGVWAATFTGGGGGEQDNMISNMKTYWGF